MDFRDEQTPAGEEWYYEFGGRAHGPMRWSDLEDLLSRTGETASTVRIRKGVDGTWTAFRSGASTTNTPAASVPAHLAIAQSETTRPVAPANWEGIRSLLRQRWEGLCVVGVWVLLNLLLLLFFPEPYAQERRYLATLQNLVNEADDLRASGASGKEWADLTKRTKERLAPMIADLQKSASSSESLRQQLLWCARDLAPRIIGPQTKEREENERRMKRFLESVGESLH
jgi:hypothetical protein